MKEVTAMGLKIASQVRGWAMRRSAVIAGIAVRHDGRRISGNRYRKQTSLTAGTILHSTRLPLTVWFVAIYPVVTARNGILSVEPGRRLGVRHATAWTMKQKIMAVMARCEKPPSGRMQMDDAHLGGVLSGGRWGRGAPGRTPFVAAVPTDPEGRPRKAKPVVPVGGFRRRGSAHGAKSAGRPPTPRS